MRSFPPSPPSVYSVLGALPRQVSSPVCPMNGVPGADRPCTIHVSIPRLMLNAMPCASKQATLQSCLETRSVVLSYGGTEEEGRGPYDAEAERRRPAKFRAAAPWAELAGDERGASKPHRLCDVMQRKTGPQNQVFFRVHNRSSFDRDSDAMRHIRRMRTGGGRHPMSSHPRLARLPTRGEGGFPDASTGVP